MAWPLSGERIAIIARITPAVKTAGAEIFSDIFDMSHFQEALVLFNMGAYAAGNDGTVAVKVEVGNATDLSDAVDLTGKALTAASFTGSTGDDAVGEIRFRNEEMVVSGTEYRYARVSVTPANQNLALGLLVLGLGCRYQPATDKDLAAVTEIIQ